MLAFFVQLTFAVTALGEVRNPITTIRIPGVEPPFYINDNASDYQNMMELIETEEPQYIYYRSYERDPLFGNVGLCPYLRRRPKKVPPTPLKLIMGYQRLNKSLVKFKRPAEYQRSEKYSVNNILWIEKGNHHNTTRRYTLVFTNNSTCSVVRSDLGNGWEIWVPKSALSQGPTPCCNFLYQLLCGKEQYQMSNSSCPQEEPSTPSLSDEDSSEELSEE
uniref:Putative salivary lipocalin n=1 Tax=Ixodes ricinus TaxID=34613 RepID=A0A0K8RLE0_IXORI